MARYRKIDPRIWNDYKFLSLSIYGRMMFLFILTHPNMTSIGALRGTREGLARELASTAGSGEDLTGGTTEALTEAYAKGYDELLAKALVEEDKKSNFVYAKNFLKFNLPESPKVCISFKTALEFLPECDLLTVAMARTAKIIIENQSSNFVQALPKEFREAYKKAYAEAFPLDIPLSKNYELRTNKEEKEKEKKEKVREAAKRETAKRLAQTLKKPEGVSDDLWQEWVAHKKRVSKTCTQRMVDSLVREAALAGMTPAQAMELQLEKGWVGFEASYVRTRNGNSQRPFSLSQEIPFDQRDYDEGINDDHSF